MWRNYVPHCVTSFIHKALFMTTPNVKILTLSGMVFLGFLLLLFTATDSGNTTPNQQQLDRMLYEASGRGDIKKVSELLRSGANVNKAHEPGNMTPLIIAAENDITVVTLLIKQGAHPNWQNQQGKTALTIATYANKTDIVKLLVQHGADPDIIDDFGDTALMSAVFRGNPDLVQYFVKLGADPLQDNKRGDSALDVAIRLVAYVEKMDDTTSHDHHHGDDDHVVTDKKSALIDRNKIVKILQSAI